MNAVPYIGHTAVRRYVMGEECFEREANDDEIQRMRMEVAKGMAAGACGFSTSQASSHVGYYEEPIPSRFATDHEIETLASAVGDANAGNLMVLCRSAIEGINADDRKLLIRLSADNGRPVIIQGRLIQEAIDAGAGVFGLLQARPFDRIFNLKHTTILDGLLTWGAVLRSPMEERLRLLRDPETRAAMRHDVEHPNTDRTKGVVLPPPPWETIFVNTVKLDKNRGLEGKSVVEISKETGKHIADVIVDLALEEDLETFFRYYKGRTDEEEERMLRDLRSPYAVLGISDAGAHLDRDDGAYYATHFLQEYVRDKGLFSLEEAVRMLTFVPAAVWNIYDRGILRPRLRRRRGDLRRVEDPARLQGHVERPPRRRLPLQRGSRRREVHHRERRGAHQGPGAPGVVPRQGDPLEQGEPPRHRRELGQGHSLRLRGAAPYGRSRACSARPLLSLPMVARQSTPEFSILVGGGFEAD